MPSQVVIRLVDEDGVSAEHTIKFVVTLSLSEFYLFGKIPAFLKRPYLVSYSERNMEKAFVPGLMVISFEYAEDGSIDIVVKQNGVKICEHKDYSDDQNPLTFYWFNKQPVGKNPFIFIINVTWLIIISFS